MYDDLSITAQLDSHITQTLYQHIEAHYPWLPTRMDFSRIPHHQYLNWCEATDQRVTEFILSSPVAHYEYMVVFYGISQPGLIFETTYAAEEFDYISKGNQQFMVMGGHPSDNGWFIDTNDLIYAHTGSEIWFTNQSHDATFQTP